MEEKFRIEVEQLTNPDLIEETEEYYIFKKEDWNKFLEKLQNLVESKEKEAFEAARTKSSRVDYTYDDFKDYKNDK